MRGNELLWKIIGLQMDHTIVKFIIILTLGELIYLYLVLNQQFLIHIGLAPY